MNQQSAVINNQPDKKNKRRNLFIAIAVFIISIVAAIVVSLMALKDDFANIDIADFFEASAVWFDGWYWILAAIGCFIVVLLTSAGRIYVLLKAKRQRVSFLDCHYYGLLSKYYVLITPLGMGGQPAAMVLMHKKNIPLGLATFVPMVDLFSMRFAMMVLGIVFFILFPNIVSPWIAILAYIGLFITCFLPSLWIAFSWYPPFEKIVLALLSKLRFLKRREQYQKVISSTFEKYRESFAHLKGSKRAFVLVIVLAIISQLAVVSVPFFILKAYPVISGPSISFNYFNTVALCLYATISVAFIPTIGNAGAIEFTFQNVFSMFMVDLYLFWAMLAWRFITFYLFLLLGLLTVIYLGVYRKREQRRHHIPDHRKKMRVVLFADNFFPMIDGVVRTLDGYARHLLAYGFEPIVVVPKYRRNADFFPYKVLRVSSIRIPGFEYALPIFPLSRKIKKTIYSDAPTIYHTHSPFVLGRKALKLARAFNMPIVSTFHSKYHDDFKTVLRSQLIANFAVASIIGYYKKVDHVWTVSQRTAATLRKYGYKNKVKVVENGTDFIVPANIDLYTRQTREFLNINDNEHVILFVGHLIWQKNIRLIIKTLKELDRHNFPYHMIFIGEGGHEKKVKNYVLSQQIIGRVTFGGVIHNQDMLAGVYKSAKLLFFPSIYDNAPMVIKESAVCELPCLLVKNSNSAENIIDNENGYLEEANHKKMAERIINIFNNEQHRQKVAKKANETIPIAWDNVMDKVVDLYKKAIDKYYEE
jgi:1,2-diacylglycerol 3-alpha-glucosyltransferase